MYIIIYRPKTARHKDPKCKLNVEFDINQLQDLLSNLTSLWPSLNNYNTSASFWKYEFDIHGKCALEDPLIRDQHGYFEFGIDQMMKLQLLKKLKENGITPNASAQYETTRLQEVLKKEYGHNATLKCAKESGQVGVRRLEEVWICLNLTRHYIDCNIPSDCSNKFTFPPFPNY
ncbi:unnamed protein product [Schistosoma bovis]|nr:unnamed protein product [Schistosoma bovis]